MYYISFKEKQTKHNRTFLRQIQNAKYDEQAVNTSKVTVTLGYCSLAA